MSIWKLWDLYKAVKGKTWDRVVDLVFPVVFENPATIKFLGQHKRWIGFIVTMIGLGLAEAPKFWPDLAIVESATPIWIVVSGAILQQIGFTHAKSKERRDVDIPEPIEAKRKD